MTTRADIATERLRDTYNCAQSVLSSFRDETGLDDDLALKIATGLGAGMGRKQEVCGAVTGGILVLGLRHGRGTTEGRPSTEYTYLKTVELMDRFAARHGSCLCRELLRGYDLKTEEGRRHAKAEDTMGRICRPCVHTVIEILEEMKSADPA
ncbi:MAG: C_GCAxxG_C_C family protein [Syntrophaceae bacterium]|nr:C_GCAxxG_C_C family protein [Syntrophaceae bacterium]